ncbi:MAG: beta-lactamase family protein, partial [Chloroflexota bacterium]|nr:beta-lactamase family protein [Chloroflexota bacterium]
LVPFGFSGSVLIARDGEVVLEEGYGYADQQREVPATAETVFSTGSVTKQFTAAAILKLEMDGKLSVEDPITEYLEDVPPDKQAITLHQLLTHSSGLAPFGNFFGDYEAWESRDESIARFLGEPLLFEPGTGYEYSNAGYSILAAIIEMVSGQSYEAYLREKLFLPAGMMQTGYRLPDWEHSQLAHFPEVPRGLNPEGFDTPLDVPFPFWLDLGNGEILSTVGDLFKWKEALKNHTVLDEEATEKLFQPHVSENLPGIESYYGYGWVISTSPSGTRHIWHNGGTTGGMSAEFHWYPDDELVLIVLSNALLDGPTDGAARLVYDRLQALLFDEPLVMPPAAAAPIPSSEELARLAGTYETENVASFTLLLQEGGGPIAEAQDAAALRLLVGNVSGDGEEGASTLSGAEIRSVVEGLAQGEVDAYVDLLPPGAPTDEEEQFWSGWARESSERFGEFRRAEFLGTSQYGPWRQHFVAVEFARGYQFVACIPLEQRSLFCMTDRAILIPTTRPLVAQSANELVAFSPLFENVVHLRVADADGDLPTRVIITTDDGDVVAERVDVVE